MVSVAFGGTQSERCGFEDVDDGEHSIELGGDFWIGSWTALDEETASAEDTAGKKRYAWTEKRVVGS